MPQFLRFFLFLMTLKILKCYFVTPYQGPINFSDILENKLFPEDKHELKLRGGGDKFALPLSYNLEACVL